MHLIEIEKKEHLWQKKEGQFPFSLPIFEQFGKVTLDAPVTFLVGENGSGKSTFIEALASGIGKIAIGSHELGQDDSLTHANALGDALRFAWRKKTARGFFLRAEDFFGFARRLTRQSRELEEMAQEFEQIYEGDGRDRAVGMARGQSRALINKYDGDLDERSHGESFIAFFKSRFVPGGLYLLDEPEAPLSPLRQIAFLAMIKEMVQQNSQFVIATHSPILMAYPGARILCFDGGKIEATEYDHLEHVVITKSFLNDPGRFLHKL